jgi:DNA-damage-inducible protein D
MLKTNEITKLFSQFEEAAAEYDGIECWSARELQSLLGYTKWENFSKVIDKAKMSCENVGQEITDHFPDVRKTIAMPKGAEKEIDDKGFAIIRSKGDKALFRLDTNQLKRKFGVPEKRPVADFLPTVSIKAKDFAAAMTAENVQIKNLSGVPAIEKEHVENNLGVRKIMIERGLVPENLPPAEDVKKVERRLNTEKEKLLKPAK